MSDEKLALGVCAGLAERTGADVSLIRIAFVAAMAIGGLGALAYLTLAVLMRPPKARADPRAQEVAGLALIAAAGVFAMASTGVLIAPAAFGALALLLAGVALLIRRHLTVRAVRIACALALVAGGIAVFTIAVDDTRALPGALASGAVVAAGGALLVGPRVRRARAEAAHERAERIRADERAQVAAQLHDSVLQTLALVQRSDDMETAKRLARGQERQLRAWLYDGQAPDDPATLGGALRAAAADVEQRYRVAVDLVQTRDAGLDARLAGLAAAAREAMVNAAKHSGAPTISVYVRLTQAEAAVFVRDEGRGFDPATVPGDRRGLRDSVTRRIAAHGGVAHITSNEDGSEIELSLPL